MKRICLLLLPLAAHAAAPVTDWSPNLTLLAAWHSNVTNGEAVWDRIGALDLGADTVASSQYVLSEYDTAHLTAHFAADWFPRFDGLDQGAAGGRLDWQHAFGRDALAPVLVLEASGDGVLANESPRNGLTGAVTLHLRKRFGVAWRAGVTQQFERYSARKSVFDHESSTTTAEIGRDLGEVTRVVFSASWRDGDVITYAQYHRPDLLAIAAASESNLTFRQLMTAYRIHAHNVSSKINLIRATSDAAAIEVGYEYAQTKRMGLRFENQIISLSIVRQF